MRLIKTHQMSIKVVVVLAGVATCTNCLKISKAQDASLPQLCGRADSTIQLNGNFWAAEFSSSSLQQSIPANTQLLPTRLIPADNHSYTFDYYLSQDGQAIVFFTAELPTQLPSYSSMIPLNTNKSVDVVTTGGAHLSIPYQANWWKLGPELSPGHFGVLAYDENQFATILDLSWATDRLTIRESESLPFKINPRVWQDQVFISPDWSFLAYTDDQEQSFNIYARTEKHVVWSLKPVRDFIPQVSWLRDDKAIAIINMGGADGDGKIIKVDRQGKTQTLIDLATFFPNQSYYPIFTDTSNDNHLVAISGQLEQTDQEHYFLLNTDSGKIAALCYIPFTKTVASNPIWIMGGAYLAIQDLDTYTSTPSALTVVSVLTGDYTQRYPVGSGKILEIVAWSSKGKN